MSRDFFCPVTRTEEQFQIQSSAHIRGRALACSLFSFYQEKKKKQNGKMPRGGRDSGDKEGNNPPPCLDQRRRHKPYHSPSHEAWMSNRRSRCNPSIASGHTAEKEVGILVSLYFFPVNIDSLSLCFSLLLLVPFLFLPKESLPCARYTAHVQYRHKCLRLSPPRGERYNRIVMTASDHSLVQ